MTVKGLSIKEQQSKNGSTYLALILVTDDKENPEKILGFINKTSVKCIPLKKNN